MGVHFIDAWHRPQLSPTAIAPSRIKLERPRAGYIKLTATQRRSARPRQPMLYGCLLRVALWAAGGSGLRGPMADGGGGEIATGEMNRSVKHGLAASGHAAR